MKMLARVLSVAVAAVVCGAAIVKFAYQPFACSREMTRLTQLTDAVEDTANDYERTMRARRNLERLSALRAECPTDVRVHMLTGANLEILGRPEDALASYQAALAADQRPEIYAAIGEIQIQLGRPEDAIASYVRAARFNRNLYDYIHSDYVLSRVRKQLDAEQ